MGWVELGGWDRRRCRRRGRQTGCLCVRLEFCMKWSRLAGLIRERSRLSFENPCRAGREVFAPRAQSRRGSIPRLISHTDALQLFSIAKPCKSSGSRLAKSVSVVYITSNIVLGNSGTLYNHRGRILGDSACYDRPSAKLYLAHEPNRE